MHREKKQWSPELGGNKKWAKGYRASVTWDEKSRHPMKSVNAMVHSIVPCSGNSLGEQVSEVFTIVKKEEEMGKLVFLTTVINEHAS